MSAEHKRPLYAFVVVTIVCALLMGWSLRTEGVVDVIARTSVSPATLTAAGTTLHAVNGLDAFGGAGGRDEPVEGTPAPDRTPDDAAPGMVADSRSDRPTASARSRAGAPAPRRVASAAGVSAREASGGHRDGADPGGADRGDTQVSDGAATDADAATIAARPGDAGDTRGQGRAKGKAKGQAKQGKAKGKAKGHAKQGKAKGKHGHPR